MTKTQKNIEPQKNIERWEYFLPKKINTASEALEFVRKRKNIFADFTKYSVISRVRPYAIKEVTGYNKMRVTWVWVFYDDKYIIYIFEGIPKLNEIKELIR